MCVGRHTSPVAGAPAAGALPMRPGPSTAVSLREPLAQRPQETPRRAWRRSFDNVIANIFMCKKNKKIVRSGVHSSRLHTSNVETSSSPRPPAFTLSELHMPQPRVGLCRTHIIDAIEEWITNTFKRSAPSRRSRRKNGAESKIPYKRCARTDCSTDKRNEETYFPPP